MTEPTPYRPKVSKRVGLSLLSLGLLAVVLELFRPRSDACQVRNVITILCLVGLFIWLLILSFLSAHLARMAGGRRVLGRCIAYGPACFLCIVWIQITLPYANEHTYFARFVTKAVPTSVHDLKVYGGFAFESFLVFQFSISPDDVPQILETSQFRSVEAKDYEAKRWSLQSPLKYAVTNSTGHTRTCLIDRDQCKMVYIWESE